MLKRKMYDDLVAWKNRKHKPLLVKGQRQVGKTFIIDWFGRDHYSCYLRFDLGDEDIRHVFETVSDVSGIIKGLVAVGGEAIEPGALIFLDEVQECPRARSALKAFDIDGRYDVIAAGTLISTSCVKPGAENPLMPMGHEEQAAMRSLDFEEFLWAKGIDASAIDDVRRCIKGRSPILPAVCKVFEDAFTDFMIVGGMPESVSSFIESGDYIGPSEVQKRILGLCADQIGKCRRRSDAAKVLECFKSIPSQLADPNKKFTYSRISGMSGRAAHDRYAWGMMWLEDSGFVSFCRAAGSLSLPLAACDDLRSFKLYMSDTGLLTSMYGKDAVRALYLKDTGYSNGAIVENAVAECLMKAGYTPRYYRKTNGENKMELDFVLEMGMELCVIDVESGSRKTSLEKASKVFNIGRKIKLEDGNIYVDEDGVEHYPIFAAAFMKDMEPEWNGPRFRSQHCELR